MTIEIVVVVYIIHPTVRPIVYCASFTFENFEEETEHIIRIILQKDVLKVTVSAFGTLIF